jgi:hypothetical protein
MLAVDSGTLGLPRLALHRETVRALTGGLVHAMGGNGKAKGPKPNTEKKHCLYGLTNATCQGQSCTCNPSDLCY